MYRYIDAEKLTKKFEKMIDDIPASVDSGAGYVIDEVYKIIESLQQEQPKTSNNLVDVDAVREDFITEVYRVLDADPTNDRANAIIGAFDSLPTVCREQSEYGYLSTTYIHGKKARWNIGDTLAYYLCTSNEEGEIIIGKITKVEFSNEEGWVYTFEDENTCDEQSLVEEGVYKIIEK